MTENPRIKCPECGGSSRRLLGSGAGLIFKGSGFYETDYKKKDGKPTGKPEPSKVGASKGDASNGDGVKSDSSSEAKSDSQAASKSESKGNNGSKAKGN